MEGRGRRRPSKACSSIRLAIRLVTRYPLVVQLHGGPAESDKFGYGPGVIVNYVPVLAARGYAVLRPNYRGSTGYGDAFLRDVRRRILPQHAPRCAGRRGSSGRDGHGRCRSACGDGLECRRPPHEQADHAHEPVQGGLVDGRRGELDVVFRADRHADESGAVVRRNAVAAERAVSTAMWRESPVSRTAAVTTPTLFFVGRGRSAGADAAVGGDVSGAARQRGADAAAGRAARGASVGRTAASVVTRRTPSSSGSSATCGGRCTRGRRRRP